MKTSLFEGPQLRQLFLNEGYDAEERWIEQKKIIQKLNPVYRAYITVFDSPLVHRGFKRRPFRGLCFAVKDVFHIKNTVTTAGSNIFKNQISKKTAKVVEKLFNLGGAVNGKTNLHEFAFGVSNINPHFGACLNPFDQQRVSGGSSGGSAVAVALGMCDVALGTDTAGSVRIPASFCGVVGFKPTLGSISAEGVIPLSWSMDHVGILARNVWETAYVFSALTNSENKPSNIGPARLEGLRVGIPKNFFLDYLDREVRRIFENSIKAMEVAGVELVDIEMKNVEKAIRCRTVIAFAEAAAYHVRIGRGRLNEYGEDVRKRFVSGLAIPACAYLNALSARKRLTQSFIEVFRDIDVLATPTTITPAHRLDEEEVEVEGKVFTVREATLRNTEVFNLYGSPAISLPAGLTSNKLPVGIQLIACNQQDLKLLRIAYAVEKLLKF